MLEKTMRVNALYDFYQLLLTAKQQQYMDLYYLNDFSLGEIAEEFHVSRQAVYDNLKRTESMLESFEEKLGLYKKYQERLKLLTELKSIVRAHFGESHDIMNIIYKLENLD
ncbi:putative DNA-binding protein YlxM (UPF0122 family) [Scopulibacillus daqui]|uniref:UPF0122 protein JOD45_000523 n=1 Tax=Scopulibacillus daqui TaxID=1469162 RepID=A0ABS2PWD4_9BACL|nr:putative DNA-binding protein [Scopulibacillus daqui]MBM7644330.1 putative DNA-binding protein YlxM (UPF0122 family) [Scopulibacillus daqui]